jgi:hypothetical protein
MQVPVMSAHADIHPQLLAEGLDIEIEVFIGLIFISLVVVVCLDEILFNSFFKSSNVLHG